MIYMLLKCCRYLHLCVLFEFKCLKILYVIVCNVNNKSESTRP